MAKTALVLSTILLTIGSLSAQSPAERAASAGLLSSGDRFQVLGTLTVEDQGGETFQRTLQFRYQRSGQEAALLVSVESPTFLRNLKFLRKDLAGRSQAWVKTSRAVRVLATDSSPEPLFGSDFTSADFTFRNRTWQSLASSPAGLVGLVCTDAEGEQTLFLREADNLVVRSEYRTPQGSLWKTYEVVEWEGSAKGSPPNPKVVRMSDGKRGSVSTLALSGLSEGQKFPPGTFTPGGL